MATLNQAVQVMVDKLHAAMTGGTPLSAEEQMLIAKALSFLQSNATWEQALVAVAEEHLTDSITAITASKDAVDLAKLALEVASGDSVTAINNARALLTSYTNQLAVVPYARRELQRQRRGWPLLNRPHETMYGVNTSIKFPVYAGNDKQCLPFRFVDKTTGRVYAAYMSKGSADSGATYGPVFHFGYWKADSSFVTLLRRTNPALADSYRWAGIGNSVPEVLVLPLAKSNDPADVRVCFIVLHAGANCIISINPANDTVTQTVLTSQCGIGNTARPNPLATTQTRQLAYDKAAKRLVAGNGDFVYWDAVFGINNGDPTDTYPSAEIANTAKYIEFSGMRQSKVAGGPLNRNRWLYDLNIAAYNYVLNTDGTNYYHAEYRDTLMNPLGQNLGYSSGYGQFVGASSISDHSPGTGYSNDSYVAIAAAQNIVPMQHVTPHDKVRQVWSYLVRKEDGSVDFEQAWITPVFDHQRDCVTSTSTQHRWKLVGADIDVVDSNGNTVASLYVETPTRNKISGGASNTTEQCTFFIPVAFDSVNRVIHFMYALNGNYVYYNGGTYTSSSHGISELDAIYKENGYV